MKNINFIIAILFISYNSYCQELPCATEISKEYAENMRQTLPEFELYKEQFIAHYGESGSRSFASKKNSIPIKLYIVRQTSGLTSLDTSLVTKGINFMNKKFAGAGLEFYICGAYNYINNSTYYNLDNTEYETLNNTYGTLNVINLYMVNSITHAGSSAIGVAPTPGGSSWVMMRNNADTTVYAHEMGHFFGLLHTHGYSNTVNSKEFVDGSNCHDEGDYFCDTPADPRLSPAISVGANVNSSCIYFGALKDGHYQTYVPDATNIMSYAPHKCLSHFSTEQLAYINWVYLNRRANLSCATIRVNFNSNSIVKCDSPYVFNFLNESAGLTAYRWDINDDDVIDYTTTNPTHTYTSPGIKWVSLSGTNAGRTYMRYKPIEFITPTKVPSITQFNTSLLLPNGWKFINLDNGRNWEVTPIIGANGIVSNVLRFRNFNYIGYEEEDEILSNSFDLRGFKNARLSFDLAYAPHAVTDTFLVYISTDCGLTYPTQILKLYGASLQTHAKQFQEFVPSESDWKNIVISLNSYVNNYVRIKIVNYNMGGNNIYIDNIRIDGGDSTLNEVGFGVLSMSTSENNCTILNGCREYKIISVPVFISNSPTIPITATITSNGTSTNLYDYEIITPTIVFPSGSNAMQYVQLKIWDDHASESIENINLYISLSGTSIYRTTSKNLKTEITLVDNDPLLPENKLFSKVLLHHNFDDLLTDTIPGWTGEYISTSANGAWFYDGYLATRNNTLDSTDYMLYWYGGGTHPAWDVLLETPILDIKEYDSITFEMDQLYKVYLPYSGDIILEAWNGSTWVNLYTYNAFLGNLGEMYKPNHINIAAVGFTNTDFKFRFGILNDEGCFWYLVDNVKITGFKTKAKVASTLHSSTNRYIGPNELVHLYDDTSGNIIGSIQNLTNWNYGCTNIELDRAGDSIIAYTTYDTSYYATQKTIIITPVNNNPIGEYDISLYYKNTEMNNWINKTHNTLADMNIIKTGGSISNITPTNVYANGPTNYSATNMTFHPYLSTDYKISGKFIEGFSGFAAAKMYTIPLPVVLLSPLKASYLAGQGNMISWKTASEINCDYFEIQRSSDAINYYDIKKIAGNGNSTQSHTYSYLDINYNKGYNYYRFKQFDFNKDFSYSNIDVVYNSYIDKSSITIFPNPVKDYININYNIDKIVSYEIVDMNGRIVLKGLISNAKIDMSLLNSGFYILHIIDDQSQNISTSKIIKL